MGHIKAFYVDDANSDDEHFYVDVPSRSMTVAITRTDEGVVVDLYPLAVADEPLASTYAFTAEAINEE